MRNFDRFLPTIQTTKQQNNNSDKKGGKHRYKDIQKNIIFESETNQFIIRN